MAARASKHEGKLSSLKTSNSKTSKAASLELSPEEFSRRVKLLTRFRELLQAQRDRFRDYLNILDKQKDAIEYGSVEELTAYVELEERIVLDISSIQKVINPLESMYQNIKGDDDLELSGLRTALEGLSRDAVTMTERNKELLSHRMSSLRTEIMSLKHKPFTNPPSIYGKNEEPAFIDIRG